MSEQPVTWQNVDWSTVTWDEATGELDRALINVELLAGRMATLVFDWCKPEGQSFACRQVGEINLQLLRANAARIRMREFEDALRESQQEPRQ